MLVYFTDGPFKGEWREVQDGLPFIVLPLLVPEPKYWEVLPGDEDLVWDRITYDFVRVRDTDGFSFMLGYSEVRPVVRALLRGKGENYGR